MNNRDDEEQQGFKDSFGAEVEHIEPEQSNIDEDFVEEAYSANYPEDADDFQLEGDLGEAQSDSNDWPEEEASSEDVELLWGDDDNPTPSADEAQANSAELDENPFDDPEPSLPPLAASSNLEDEPSWTDDPGEAEQWLEDDMEEDENEGPEWPLGLIAIAIVALLLLGAGGYGVMQQRAEAAEEIRELRAALATAVPPKEASDDREALREIEARNKALQSSITSLQLENSQLKDTVAGLEAQLEVQREAAAALAKPTPKPTPKPKPKAQPKPAPKPAAPAAASGSGSWFVNFSSYSQRSTAEEWRQKLSPSRGQVAITQFETGGKTLYRLRVVGLASRESAQAVAAELARDWGIEKPWVGKQ